MQKLFKITNLYSTDLDCNKVSCYEPEDPEDICFQMYLDLECEKTGRSTEFQCDIVSPKGLLRIKKKYGGPNLLSDRAMLVYSYFDYDELVKDLDRILDGCVREPYLMEDVVRRMERYFQWEYQDME